MSAPATTATPSGHELEQSKFWIFVQLAMLLAVITGLGTGDGVHAVPEVDPRHRTGDPLTVKFMFVIFYFMHLRWDKAFCTSCFSSV